MHGSPFAVAFICYVLTVGYIMNFVAVHNYMNKWQVDYIIR